MQALKQFSIPLKGMKIGLHEYNFEIDSSFFLEFDNTSFSNCSFLAKLILDRKSDHLKAEIFIEGTIQIDCDRCTDNIAYPFNIESDYLIKYSEEEKIDIDVVFIHPESPDYNCAKVLYDTILLARPISMTCDEVVDKSCNELVIKVLHKEEKSKGVNPLAEGLKNLKID